MEGLRDKKDYWNVPSLFGKGKKVGSWMLNLRLHKPMGMGRYQRSILLVSMPVLNPEKKDRQE